MDINKNTYYYFKGKINFVSQMLKYISIYKILMKKFKLQLKEREKKYERKK